jgi:hypothetical protein
LVKGVPHVSCFGLAATNGFGEASGVSEDGDGSEIGIIIDINYDQPHMEPKK